MQGDSVSSVTVAFKPARKNILVIVMMKTTQRGVGKIKRTEIKFGQSYELCASHLDRTGKAVSVPARSRDRRA